MDLSGNTSDDRSDAILIMYAQKGDQEAFAILFLRYKVEIYICLRRVIHNEEIVRDLWQDTYLKVWNNIQNLKEPFKFKGWLLTIARNLAFDQLRKILHQRVGYLKENGGTSDPLNEIVQQECVQYALANLRPVHREVLLLAARGYSRAEIAHELGYEESTVGIYLAQARKQARELYHQLMDNPDEIRKEK